MVFAWPLLKPRTILGAAKNLRFFFESGDWPTPEEQVALDIRGAKKCAEKKQVNREKGNVGSE